MLMEMGRPAEAEKHFLETLKRTPGRPKAILGIARAAQARGDRKTAALRFAQLLEIWKNADSDLDELALARKLLASRKAGAP